MNVCVFCCCSVQGLFKAACSFPPPSLPSRHSQFCLQAAHAAQYSSFFVPPNYEKNLFSGKSIENGWFMGEKNMKMKKREEKNNETLLLCINLEFSFRGKFSVFVPSYQMKMGCFCTVCVLVMFGWKSKSCLYW